MPITRIPYTGDGTANRSIVIGITPAQLFVISTNNLQNVSNLYYVNTAETALVGESNIYPTCLTGILNTSVNLDLLDVQGLGLNINGATYIIYASA